MKLKGNPEKHALKANRKGTGGYKPINMADTVRRNLKWLHNTKLHSKLMIVIKNDIDVFYFLVLKTKIRSIFCNVYRSKIL